jgi:hypothetical protein
MSSTSFSVTGINSSGTVTGITVQNSGTGYTVGTLLTFGSSNARSTQALRVDNDYGETILSISIQGEVTWHQNHPTTAASKLVDSLQNCIDMKAAGEVAMARSYLQGVKKCLRIAKQVSHEDLIRVLETEVEHREGKLTWQVLNNSLENQNDT